MKSLSNELHSLHAAETSGEQQEHALVFQSVNLSVSADTVEVTTQQHVVMISELEVTKPTEVVLRPEMENHFWSLSVSERVEV